MAVKTTKSKSKILFSFMMLKEGLHSSIPAMNIIAKAREKIKEIVRHVFIRHFFFFEKRKPVLKEKHEVLLVKLFFLRKGL
jgi:hypothetical protein